MSYQKTSILKLPRSVKVWLGFFVVAMAVAVGCSEGGGAATVAGAADEAPDPVAGSKGEAPTSVVRAEDAAPDFEIVLFETANHQAGEVLRLSELQGSDV